MYQRTLAAKTEFAVAKNAKRPDDTFRSFFGIATLDIVHDRYGEGPRPLFQREKVVGLRRRRLRSMRGRRSKGRADESKTHGAIARGAECARAEGARDEREAKWERRSGRKREA